MRVVLEETSSSTSNIAESTHKKSNKKKPSPKGSTDYFYRPRQPASRLAVQENETGKTVRKQIRDKGKKKENRKKKQRQNKIA